MNQTTNPACGRRRRPGRAARPGRAESELPDFGRWVRRVREERQLTRARAADLLHVSTELLKKIEYGNVACSPAVLDHLVGIYDLDHAQQRHTRDLAQPPIPLSPVAELRARAGSPEHHAKLAYLDRRNLASAYLDPLWNVVLANNRFRAELPDVEHYRDNLALWFFHPGSSAATAETLLVQWDCAAAHLVASLRGAFGRHRATPGAFTLYRQLRGSDCFTQIWDTSLSVAYGARTEQPVLVHDPVTGEPRTARIHLGAQGSPDLHFFLAYHDRPPL
ncbi:MmyB family transcriptional regulator [Nocardia brevicatena]|uniref:MmyB family transcriptional regulator n=1 Tax=Nocardia brevicatena TaxID=37327 RepID=UPI0002E10D8C|nr:helix-turn-helix domain-containing protein [Nocardia brevicatena]